MRKLTNSIKSAAENAKDTINTAKIRANNSANDARKKAIDAFDLSKDAAARGVRSSRELANKAAIKSSDALGKNPVTIVLGGLALGAIIGALLPRTDKEDQILSKTGKKLNGTMRNVANAGKVKLTQLNADKDAPNGQFRDLVSKAAIAVKAAGSLARKQD